MCLAAGEPLDEWTEVLDVVRHHRAEFVGCGLKKGPVAAADEVRAVRDRVDVVDALAQQHSDLRRALLARSASRTQGALAAADRRTSAFVLSVVALLLSPLTGRSGQHA